MTHLISIKPGHYLPFRVISIDSEGVRSNTVAFKTYNEALTEKAVRDMQVKEVSACTSH